MASNRCFWFPNWDRFPRAGSPGHPSLLGHSARGRPTFGAICSWKQGLGRRDQRRLDPKPFIWHKPGRGDHRQGMTRKDGTHHPSQIRDAPLADLVLHLRPGLRPSAPPADGRIRAVRVPGPEVPKLFRSSSARRSPRRPAVLGTRLRPSLAPSAWEGRTNCSTSSRHQARSCRRYKARRRTTSIERLSKLSAPPKGYAK